MVRYGKDDDHGLDEQLRHSEQCNAHASNRKELHRQNDENDG